MSDFEAWTFIFFTALVVGLLFVIMLAVLAVAIVCFGVYWTGSILQSVADRVGYWSGVSMEWLQDIREKMIDQLEKRIL